jgi:hypothetical protein
MIDEFLLPDRTTVTAKGDSEPFALDATSNRTFLLTLDITSVVEQEAIEIQVFASEDGTTWPAKPLAVLPQKFYPGGYPLLIDLTACPQAKFLRAHWDVNRWGRGSTTPKFTIGLRLREVPQEVPDNMEWEVRCGC